MSEIDVSKCEYYYEYPSNDIECNSALEGNNCKKVCHNKDCKWSLCSENEYCGYKVNWCIQQLKVENEELRKRIIKIFACLIDANRTGEITSTLWIDDITTLWDYIAQTLRIEGDQTQIEEQILQLIKQTKEGES